MTRRTGVAGIAALAAAMAAPAQAASRGKRFVRIPPGLDGAVIEEADSVTVEDVDVDAARRIADAAAKEETLRWLFRGFDDTHLHFSIARLVPGSTGGRRPWVRLTVIRRLRVARSIDAENRLGVRTVVEDYQRGRRGIRAGMSPQAVKKSLGEPTRTEQLGPVGSFDFIYPDRRVRFLGGRVAIPDVK